MDLKEESGFTLLLQYTEPKIEFSDEPFETEADDGSSSLGGTGIIN